MMRRRARRGVAGAGGPVRVAFLTPTLSQGGAERQQLLLAELLPRPAFEVRFIALLERGDWASRAESLGVRVDVLGLSRPTGGLDPRWGLDGLRATGRYRDLVRDVDIVDAWLAPSFTFAALNQPFARVPVMIAGRRSLSDLYRGKSGIRRAVTSWAARRAAAVVANSQVAAREVVSDDRVDASRVVVIPNAVLPVVADPAAAARMRRTWGFGERDLVVGCVANYKPGKGLGMLIEIGARIRGQAPDLRYVLVGDGPSRDELAAAISRLALDSVVVLAGRIDDARSLYPAFDIAVQTSTSEGLPNAVLEAAAAGLPIVATDVGGTAEILESAERGVLIRPGDPDGLAGALLRVAGDPALRSALGRAALERSADFSTSHLVEATSALYVRLLDEHRRRHP
jgi:glycosyltransferase involved in cell wall biosynthesis